MAYSEEDYQTVKEMLLNHRGKDNLITSGDINEEVELDTIDSRPKTRKCIRDVMERDGIPIVGTGNGYYVAETEEEIESALSTLESRIMKMTERKMLLKRAAREWEDQLAPSDDADIL